MLRRDETKQKLKELNPILAERWFVDKIGYFGSFARDEQTVESDLDILVSLSKTPGWEFFVLQRFLENSLNIEVDLISVNALKRQLRSEILSSVRYL